MKSHPWMTPFALTLLAFLAQGAAMLTITSCRGSSTAYAYQSPDSAEYVAFARGLAWQGRYRPLDSTGKPLPYANTWRTPGYPIFLAIIIRLFGDNAIAMLLAQQVAALATVPLAYALIRRFTTRRWAIAATAIWAVDPFRLYYSQWLLAETLFIFILLLAAWAWIHPGRDQWTYRRSVSLGIATGIAVLVRPIGLLLPPLAWLGVGLTAWRRSQQSNARSHAICLALACAAGTSAVVGPYLIRNRMVARHFSLTPQSGPSFAYHKVVDVVLYAQGRSRYRFDAQTLGEIRTEIDHRLQRKWEHRYGPLTPARRDEITFAKLNFGRAKDIDPFAASSLLWSVGLDLMADHPKALMQCFADQGVKMLIFPLGLVLSPPAGDRAAPLSMLLGSKSATASLLATALGTCYAVLALVVIARLLISVCRRCWPDHFFVIWPTLTLLTLTLPFEDPRFRLPMIPFLLLLAVGRQVRHT